jgi:HEAT repeat protein
MSFLRLFGPPDIGRLKADRDVKRLVKALDHPRPEVSHGAAEALCALFSDPALRAVGARTFDDMGWWGTNDEQCALHAMASLDWAALESSPAGFEPLLILLNDRDKNVVGRAARSLGHRKDPRAVEPLLGALLSCYHISDDVRHALAEIGPSVIDRMIVALGHRGFSSPVPQDGARPGSTGLDGRPAMIVRRTAAQVLGALKAEAATDALIAASGDDNETVRCEVVRALGEVARHGDSRLLQPLTAALRDREHDVRGAAAEALGRLGDPRAASALEFALREPVPAGHLDEAAAAARGWSVRCRIVEALGQVGGEDAARVLVRTLGVKDLRIRALEALETCGNASAIGPLLELLSQWTAESRPRLPTIEKTLRAVLERTLADVSLEQLQALAALRNEVSWYNPNTLPDNCAMSNAAKGTVDLSTMKQLARQELVRRGVVA